MRPSVTPIQSNKQNYSHICFSLCFWIGYNGLGQNNQYIDSLQTRPPGDRIPVQAKFSAPILTNPQDPSSPLYNWKRVTFPGVKRTGCGVDHPPPFSTEVKERVELYFCSHSGPSWPVLGRTLPLPGENTERQKIMKPVAVNITHCCLLSLTSM
jgi:hypothetical protein